MPIQRLARRDGRFSLHSTFQIGMTGCCVIIFGILAIPMVSVTFFPSHEQIALEAVRANDLERLKSVISMVDIAATHMGSNIQDNRTLLSTAVVESNSKIVLLLLEYGSDPNHQGAYKDWSPLHRITFYHVENTEAARIIKLLIKYGADPTITDRSGKTPIDYVDEDCGEILAALQWRPNPIAE